MLCRNCSSLNTRVTCNVQKHPKDGCPITIRYCRCLDCKERFKTIERYAQAKCNNLNPNPSVGCKNGKSKLLPQDIIKIRTLHETGLTNGQIALHVKASKSTICKIVNYNTYKDIK